MVRHHVLALAAAGAFALSPLSATEGLSTELASPSSQGGAEGSGEGFDPALNGRWTGGGEVLPRIDGMTPFQVKCEIDVSTDDATFDLGGHCGALFVKKPLSVVLTREDDRISGIYEAELRTGQATLEGDYATDTFALDITWGGEVNGDTAAVMTIERTEPDAMRVRVVDRDPATGKDVVTSDLTLTRES